MDIDGARSRPGRVRSFATSSSRAPTPASRPSPGRSCSRPMRRSIRRRSARRGGASTTSTCTEASTSRSSRSRPARRRIRQRAGRAAGRRRRITLGERPRYRVRYGLAVSDEEIGPDERDRRLGFAADLENRNIFGRGVTRGRLAAAAARSAGGPRHARSQPAVRAADSLDGVRRARARAAQPGGRVSDHVGHHGAHGRTGVSGAARASNSATATASSGTTRSSGPREPDAFDLTVKIARFTTSGLVDRRDDAFNPARGWFAGLHARALDARARIRSEVPQGFRAVLTLRADRARARGGVGGSPRSSRGRSTTRC